MTPALAAAMGWSQEDAERESTPDALNLYADAASFQNNGAFELAAEPSDDTLTATADLIEPLGAETLIHLLDGERDLRVVVKRGAGVALGERAHLRCKPGQTHIFDADGRRLN